MVNHRGEVSLLILGSLCLGPETFFSQRQNALFCNVKLKNGSNSQLILGWLHVTPSHQDPEQNALLLHVVWVISADVVTPCETQFGENTSISFPMFGGKKKKVNFLPLSPSSWQREPLRGRGHLCRRYCQQEKKDPNTGPAPQQEEATVLNDRHTHTHTYIHKHTPYTHTYCQT